MNSKTPILDAALEYLDMGFSIIPVKRVDKKPYLPWKEYQGRQPTTAEVEAWWQKWPEANVAIVTGAISGIYIFDGDGPKGCEWITNNLPKTGVYSVSSPGHVHAYYRPPIGVKIPTKARIAVEVDIRGDGGYCVCPPSIHSGGHRYEFKFLMDGWEDVPVFDPIGINGKKHVINADLSNVTPVLSNAPVVQGSRNNTLAQLAGSWFSKGLSQDEATTLAIKWNKDNQPPLGETELITTVNSIYKIHLVNHPICELEPADLDIIEAEEVIPGHLLKPGGVLEQFMDYTTINSSVSVPFFNLAAALTLLGNVMGQKVMTETGLRTNLYCICLGYSGSGKNAPFSTIPTLLQRTEAYMTLGETELTSSSSLFNSFQDRPRSIYLLDEIGSVLKGLQNPQSAIADIPRMLTKLFSGTDRPEQKAYADKAKAVSVPWHHLSLIGASTPERFWESITPGDVGDGFLARVLIFESHHEAPFPKTTIAFSDDPSLRKRINDIFAICNDIDKNRGNLENVPAPKVIPRSLEAQEYFTPWAQRYHALKNEHRVEGYASIYGRAAEHAAKIALIHAISDNVAAKSVSVTSIQYGCELVDFLISNMIKKTKTEVHSNEFARMKERIIEEIKKLARGKKHPITGTDGATIGYGGTAHELHKGVCRELRPKDIDDHLKSLIISEKLGVQKQKAKNGWGIQVFYVRK